MKSVFTTVSLLVIFLNSTLPAEEISFSRSILPIFSEKCLGCHGPDKAEGGLRLDQREAAIAELDSGDFGIVPGQTQQSTLIQRISAVDQAERMPPEGDPLTPQQIKLIKTWVEQGAKFDAHWAFTPIRKPNLPSVKKRNWLRNEIDHFVLSRLEAQQIDPSPVAANATLVKRLYYDLIGLPPTPEVVDQFIANGGQQWYEQLVDDLLASKHFGEKWGRHWLDLARYADSDGYEKDRPRPNAWRYRDWVIDAINRDVPYDRFSIEQIAGDLLPNSSPEQKLATAFHRQTLTNTEGGTDQEQFRVEATFDRTETTGAIWMGLTLTCARCHTHKYDQITQEEYYQLYSFFDSANETNTEIPVSQDAQAEYAKQLANHQKKVAQLKQRLDGAKSLLQPKVETFLAEHRSKTQQQAKLAYQPAKIISAKSNSGAKLKFEADGSALVSGKAADKDKYTMVIESPTLPLSGIRIKMLTDNNLPKKGPGRAPNGNFVLSQLRLYVSDDPQFKKHQRVELAAAESDYSQSSFSAEGAISDQPKTGWAIAPQMGKPHEITFFLRDSLNIGTHQYLQVVLDQSYGGQHTIGKFKIETMTGFNPLKVFPKAVVAALQSNKPSEKQLAAVLDYIYLTDDSTAALRQEFRRLEKEAPALPSLKVRVMGPAKRTTRVLHRGDFLQPQKEVEPNVLGVVSATHPLPQQAGKSRLDFARWLLDPAHPLTARVAVNQVWAQLFGKGIVVTQNDFGVRGELPTHPELLDWLAWHFSRDLKWSRKKLIKKIVMSATYRQASVYRLDLKQLDPTNRLLARQNRFRVSAELVRDLYLAASGLLNGKIGGPSVFPPLPAGITNLSYANNFRWKTSQGDERYRRGMYTFFKRTSPHPNLITFDCPDSNTTRIERDRSNTPIQALITLNNEVYFESAQAMARRILQSKFTQDADRINLALRLCIARRPQPDEIERFVKLLNRNRKFYESNPDWAAKLLTRHVVKEVAPKENAAWVATVRIILNLDELIVRE